MKNLSELKGIIEGLTDFRIIPFFGSGMSKPCGGRTWEELINTFRIADHNQDTDYLKIAQAFEDKYGREKLLEELEKNCTLPNLSLDTVTNHVKIMSLNPPIIYTTNYDTALEFSADQIRKSYKKIVGIGDIKSNKYGQKIIVKFHGDFSDKNSIVFTKLDYDKRLALDESPLDILFRSHLLEKGLLFLGYSLTDINVRAILDKHRELFGTHNLPKSYFITFDKNILNPSYFNERNISVICLDSPDELASMIDDIFLKSFSISSKSLMDNFLKSAPLQTLTSLELTGLNHILHSQEIISEAKVPKIREILESKLIPKELEKVILDLFKNNLLQEPGDDNIKEALILSFQFMHIGNSDLVQEICIMILCQSSNPRFSYDFQNLVFDGVDAISIVERRLGEVLKSSLNTRILLCWFILMYLNAASADSEISQVHVKYLFERLRGFGVLELDLSDRGYSTEKIRSLIETFSRKFSVNYKAVLERGMRPKSAVEIMDQIEKMIPKSYLE